MKDGLPEIPEHQVSGALRDIYEDIRLVLGVPMVNLIFRHIATFPVCLEWVWGTLRPSYASGEMSRLGNDLLTNLALPARPLLSSFALRAAGVTRTDEKTISRILAVYNHANSMNVIALHTLLSLMGEGAPDLGSPVSDNPPSKGDRAGVETTEKIPPMLSLEEMDESARGLVFELMSLRPKGNVPVIASLYRHLARWPGYLALALTVLRPMGADGTLDRLVDKTRSWAEAEARALAARLAPSSVPLSVDEERRASLEKSLRFFAGDLIVEMIPSGKLLLQTLPASAV
jgi:hypothetical protein